MTTEQTYSSITTTTTTYTQTPESMESSTVITTGYTDTKTNASKKFENQPITTDPTTGNIIIVNTVNHYITKAKGKLEYSIIKLQLILFLKFHKCMVKINGSIIHLFKNFRYILLNNFEN